MRKQHQNLPMLGVIIFGFLLAGGLTWACYNYAVQLETTDAFAPLWAAARQVITDQTNPYDIEALRFYLPEGADPNSRFVYPFYGMLVFLPFGLISSYPVAKATWIVLLMAALLTIIYGALSVTSWNPSAKLLGAVVLFSLIGYPGLRGIYSGNPAVLNALLIMLGLRMVILGRDGSAGVLFGLTILKPNMVALLLPYVLLYAVSHQNYRLIRNTLLTISILIAAAFLAYPRWFGQNFSEVVLLYKESFPSSISAVISSWLPGNQFMVIAAALVGLWAVISWWQSLGKGPLWFLWTAGLTLVLTELIGIPTATANYVIFLIPLMLCFSILDKRWDVGGGIVVMILMIFILGATWGPFLLITGEAASLSEPRLMLFLLPIIVLGLLYWVRYWALTSIQMRVERFNPVSNL